MKLTFVSYNGKYPNLCRGDLVLAIDGKPIRFPSYCLNSTGGICGNLDDTYDGPWEITDYPDDFPEELKAAAVELVNDNIPRGCCGGCI